MISLKWFKKRESQLPFLGAFSAILLGVLAPALSYAEKLPDVPADLTRLTLCRAARFGLKSILKSVASGKSENQFQTAAFGSDSKLQI
jgi:hypothetical protein